MGEVRRLNTANNGPTSTEDVIAMLEEAITELKSGRVSLPFNKAVMLLLYDIKDEERGGYPYHASWYQCGMRMSECAQLCRTGELLFMNAMGYNTLPEDLEQ